MAVIPEKQRDWDLMETLRKIIAGVRKVEILK